MHERSTDPDVVKRLQAEIEWAVKVRRRYVELTPDDAVALQARIEELEALAEMWESRAKEVDAHRRALWDITGRDPKVWSEAHARAVLAKREKP